MTSREPFNLAAGRRLEDGAGLDFLSADLTPPPEMLAEATPAEVDGPTTAYVLAARPAFEGFRRSSMQLAGLLVLAATGARSRQEHPMLDLAATAYEDAADRLRGLTPPARGRHHHLHLLQADRALGEAIRRARTKLHLDDAAQASIGRAVQAGIDHLRWAGGALPGFELVALSQGCCAAHAAAAPAQETPKPGLRCTV